MQFIPYMELRICVRLDCVIYPWKIYTPYEEFRAIRRFPQAARDKLSRNCTTYCVLRNIAESCGPGILTTEPINLIKAHYVVRRM